MEMPFDPQHELFEYLASVATALAHHRRIYLLQLVAQREYSVQELAKLSGSSVNNASSSLRKLLAAGLLEVRRDGKHTFYRVGDVKALELIVKLREFAEKHLAELGRMTDAFLRSRDSLEPVSSEELLLRLQKGEVTLIDVRPRTEFDRGHLPSAVSIPLAALSKMLKDLPRGRDIVVYCRGRYCFLSYDAAALLRTNRLSARRLADGFLEWRAMGMPIEN